MIAPTLLHAAAEGGVRLNQRNVRPDGSYGLGPPLIDYEAFGKAEDVSRMVEAIRRLQTIMSQPAMAVHQPKLLHASALSAEFGEDTEACECTPSHDRPRPLIIAHALSSSPTPSHDRPRPLIIAHALSSSPTPCFFASRKAHDRPPSPMPRAQIGKSTSSASVSSSTIRPARAAWAARTTPPPSWTLSCGC